MTDTKTDDIPKYVDLTPISTADENNHYGEAIKFALDNDRVRNMAITGPYGSGKSSIIQSFEKKNKGKYSFLNISLASFSEYSKTQSSDKTKEKSSGDDEAGSKGESVLQDQNILIERSILQQMIYKVESGQLPNSRFKRLSKIKSPIWNVLFIVGTVFALTISTLLIKSNPDFPLSSRYKYFLIAFLTVGFSGLTLLLSDTLRFFKKHSLKKISLKNGEMELGDCSEKSILNRHLDEILYFFQETKFNVVVIEDLDRFGTSEIFVKLREINTLINNSDECKRTITFVYAIKDEMFLNKERTKFFDFIIPLIPVINNKNSREKLAIRLEGHPAENEIDKQFLKEVPIYIDDMRLLHNIVNEFLLYHRQIGSLTLEATKLLAMIIYKNVYPSDFSKLHHNSGFLHTVFDNADKLVQRKKTKIQSTIVATEGALSDAEKETLATTDELKAVYLNCIYEKICNSFTGNIFMNNSSYPFKELKKESIFDILRLQTDINYSTNSNYRNRNILNQSFKDIETEVNPTVTYSEREKIIKDKSAVKRVKYNQQLKELKKELAELDTKPVSYFFETLDDFLRIAGADELGDVSLIHYLVTEGYIDEFYKDYTSYFYEGSLTTGDVSFVRSIRAKKTLAFDYKISKISEIVEQLRVSDFRDKYVWNFQLVDFVLENRIDYRKHYENLMQCFVKHPHLSIDFIDQFLGESVHEDEFFQELCNHWHGLWRFIVQQSDFCEVRTDQYLYRIIQTVDLDTIWKYLNDDNLIRDFLSDRPTCLLGPQADNERNRIEMTIDKLGVYFINLGQLEEDQKLLKYVYEKAFYRINYKNIEVIIREFGKHEFGEDKITTANYTTILESGCTELISYISEYIYDYVDTIFLKLPDNTKETEETLIKLLNNDSLSVETQEKIINHVDTTITDLNKVPANLWTQLFTNSKVAVNWDNIMTFFMYDEELGEILLKVLEENTETLCKSKINSNDESVKKKLSKAILLCNDLDDNTYELLLKSIPYWKYDFLNCSSLSNEKVESLITKRKLNLTTQNYEMLEEHFTPLNARLLAKYPKEYLEAIDSYDLDEQESFELLNFLVSDNHKVAVVKDLPFEQFTGNIELSNIVLEIINKDSSFSVREVGNEFMKTFLENATDLDGRLQSFISCLKCFLFSKDDMTSILSSFGSKYAKLTELGPHPKLPNNEINLQLVLELDRFNYISSYSVKGDEIKVNTKKSR